MPQPRKSQEDFSSDIDTLLSQILTIPEKKNYWLIRTLSGAYYDTFRHNNFVGLEHNDVPLSMLMNLQRAFNNNGNKFLEAIRNEVIIRRKQRASRSKDQPDVDLRQAGLVASQIKRFYTEIKRGDTVMIPSEGSEIISFGVVTENIIGNFSEEELAKIEFYPVLKKRVRWLKDVRRDALDPYLFKMFSAHQAINEMSQYAQFIESTIQDFFVLDDEAHLVLNVATTNQISAADLFGLGSEMLRMIDDISNEFKLGIKSSDLQVTISLNSPGKINLKSKIKSVTLVSGIILFLVGGGVKTKTWSLDTKGVPGLIEAIDKYLSNSQDRELRKEVFETYKDRLQVKDPEDMIKLLKQVSDNKDSAQ